MERLGISGPPFVPFVPFVPWSEGEWLGIWVSRASAVARARDEAASLLLHTDDNAPQSSITRRDAGTSSSLTARRKPDPPCSGFFLSASQTTAMIYGTTL